MLYVTYMGVKVSFYEDDNLILSVMGTISLNYT